MSFIRWDEWVFASDAENNHRSLWDGDHIVTKKPTPLYTKSGKGRGGSSRHKGWSDAGITRFNELTRSVMCDRKTRNGIQFEDALRKDFWDAEVINEQASRKRRRVESQDRNLRCREEPIDFVDELLK